ncbi:MAG: response regulator transcription factor [Phycisphaerales bacterium]
MAEPSDNATVFVIDDDPTLRRSIEFLSESVGLKVASFGSAQEFLDGAQPSTPGAIVLDVRMPGMSGLDLLDELTDRGFHHPVIVITGHADVPMAVRALKAGAMEFIEKPFNDQDLLDRVQKAIEWDAEQRERSSDVLVIRERAATLTPREREVMDLVIEGNANKQIAATLGLSEKTIEVHRSRVMRKMQATNAADLIRMVLEARAASA